MKSVNIFPGDLAFLLAQCERCFWYKAIHNIRRPSPPIAALWSITNKLMKERLTGVNLRTLGDDFPDGEITYTSQNVWSQPLTSKEANVALTIKGEFPGAIKMTDGSYGIVSFKCGDLNEENLGYYWLQMQAYVIATEHPAQDGFDLRPVTCMGLLNFHPEDLSVNPPQFTGKFEWIDMELDAKAFMDHMGPVAKMLAEPTPPPAGEDCPWCAYYNKVGSLEPQREEEAVMA